MNQEKREHQPREMRMVSEFVEEYFPDATSRATRVRLGPLESYLPDEDLSDSERRMLKVFSRWADGVITYPDRIILIEGKIRPTIGPLEALMLYELLLPHTPDIRVGDRHVEKMFVYAVEDRYLIRVAHALGIKCVYYRPEWIDDYLEIVSPRERRSPRPPP